MQIFRQIMDGRFDLVMHGMAFCVGRPPERDEYQLEPRALQTEQFLRDEGFRQPRIALQNHDDLAVLQLSSCLQ